MAKIQLFYVGFGQKNGPGVVHIDEQYQPFRKHQRGNRVQKEKGRAFLIPASHRNQTDPNVNGTGDG